MLLNAFFWCINWTLSPKKSLWFNIFSTSAIIFIRCLNRHQMRNNIRYKGNINSTSVIIFLIDTFDYFCKLNKNSQRWYFAWENLQEVFMMLVVVLHSLLFLWCCLLLFLRFRATFSMPVVLHPGFSGLWMPPPALSSIPWLFSIALLFRYIFTASATVLSGYFFLPTGVFCLTLLPHIFATNLLLSRPPPPRRQFFLDVCGASCWSSKHRPGPSVCLIYSNLQSWHSEEFALKSYQI